MKLLFFAAFREAIGLDEDEREFPQNMTIQEVVDWLIDQDQRFMPLCSSSFPLLAALDQVLVPLDASIGEASELAFFPPMTGG